MFTYVCIYPSLSLSLPLPPYLSLYIGHLKLYGDYIIKGPMIVEKEASITATKLELTHKWPNSSTISGTMTISEQLVLEGSAVVVNWDTATFGGRGVLVCSTQPEYAGSMTNAKNYYAQECVDTPITGCKYEEGVTIGFINTFIPHKTPTNCQGGKRPPLGYHLYAFMTTATNDTATTTTSSSTSSLSLHPSLFPSLPQLDLADFLPAGITWNDTYGHFQGIPTEGFPTTLYYVTAVNRAGPGDVFPLNLYVGTYRCPAGKVYHLHSTSIYIYVYY